jgi:hypothetical protein
MGIPITSSEFDTSNSTGGTEEIQMTQLEKMHEVNKETVSTSSPLAGSSVTVPSQDAAGKPSRRSMLAARGMSGSVSLLAVLSSIELLAANTHKASEKETKVAPLTKTPAGFPGKEVPIITVDYA